MKTIHSSTSIPAALFGKQKLKDATKYRLTTHCVQVESEDGTLYFHTMTGAMLLLEQGDLIQEQEKALVADWFLVPIEHDEMKQLRKLRALMHAVQSKSKKKNHFTVLSTTDCNARCFYCYEMGCQRITMSEQTARDVGTYIVRESGGEKIKIRWFGGEPLYNAVAIDIICEELRKAGTAFASTITSNGYYLDAAMAEKAIRDWHMTGALIAIDGTKDNYQRTKAYIEKDENAYERVLSNIGHALSLGLKICVRLNVDKENGENLNNLIDELASRFARKPNFSINITPLREMKGKIHQFSTERELAEKLIQLREKRISYGIRASGKFERMIRSNHCMADADTCEVIMPDGRICKCEHFESDEMIGSIYSDRRNQETIDSWKELRDYFPECMKCSLAPRCLLLKKCERSGDHCPEDMRVVGVDELKEMVLLDYQSYKKGEEQ